MMRLTLTALAFVSGNAASMAFAMYAGTPLTMILSVLSLIGSFLVNEYNIPYPKISQCKLQLFTFFN
jgi:hypothetical protein